MTFFHNQIFKVHEIKLLQSGFCFDQFKSAYYSRRLFLDNQEVFFFGQFFVALEDFEGIFFL